MKHHIHLFRNGIVLSFNSMRNWFGFCFHHKQSTIMQNVYTTETHFLHGFWLPLQVSVAAFLLCVLQYCRVITFSFRELLKNICFFIFSQPSFLSLFNARSRCCDIDGHLLMADETWLILLYTNCVNAGTSDQLLANFLSDQGIRIRSLNLER